MTAAAEFCDQKQEEMPEAAWATMSIWSSQEMETRWMLTAGPFQNGMTLRRTRKEAGDNSAPFLCSPLLSSALLSLCIRLPPFPEESRFECSRFHPFLNDVHNSPKLFNLENITLAEWRIVTGDKVQQPPFRFMHIHSQPGMIRHQTLNKPRKNLETSLEPTLPNASYHVWAPSARSFEQV